jgi:hypothetical protein
MRLAPGWNRRWWPLAWLIGVILGWGLLIWMAEECRPRVEECEHGWLEYWLNRYQTLIGALAALAAAWYAGRWVSCQVTLAQKQLDAAMGDLPPDFVLEPAGYEGSPSELQIEDLILRVNNQNRRPLQIISVSLRPPRGPVAGPWSSDFASDAEKEFKLEGHWLLTHLWTDAARPAVLYTSESPRLLLPSSPVIDGTRPAASTVNGARIR